MATEEQTSSTTALIALRSGGTLRTGQRLTITNRTVTKLSFALLKNGSPTGTVTFLIRDISDNILATKAFGNASTLSATKNWEEVTFNTPVFINEEVRLLVEFSGGSSGNEVHFHGELADVKEGEFFTAYTTFWSDFGSGGTDYDGAYIYTFTEGGSTTPVVTTQAATDVIATGATGHGNVQGLGDSAVTQHGHVWSTSQNPDTSDSKTELGAKPQAGAFVSLITGLTPGTTYYLKAYATNSSGTTYGSQVSIGTASTIQRAHIWSEGSDFHYFDEAGVERVLQGHGVASDKDLWPWLDPFS
ncbi:hypothetical protein LCGC14_1573240 [marine sediment metagenome]|uniref:Fibronectin type-III domain-containing protein n=1 Tax=marine sediment metagenome TaxID=412755 RepID=A0A0F9IJ83_9ZZZZ